MSNNKLELITDSHSKHQLGYHIVWCTKFRHKILENDIAIVLKRILSETCVAYDWKCHTLEIMPDHIHIFIQASHMDSPKTVAQTLKSISAVKLFSEFPKLKSQKFWGTGLWNRGTFYSSIENISQETIIKYIEEQKTK
jgi:putative transposase